MTITVSEGKGVCIFLVRRNGCDHMNALVNNLFSRAKSREIPGRFAIISTFREILRKFKLNSIIKDKDSLRPIFFGKL